MRRSLADRPVVAGKPLLAGVVVERRGRLTRNVHVVQPAFGREETKMSKPRLKDKSFAIPKLLVWEAWRQVKANKGAPGADGQDLAEFEADLEGNLYKIWNRMSSGFSQFHAARPARRRRAMRPDTRSGAVCRRRRRRETGVVTR